MARVTVEDCVLQVPNRFDLVLLSAQRAKQISAGAPITLERDNDKDSVVSLREIAEETIALDDVRNRLVQSFFKRQVSDIADQKLLVTGEDIPAEVEEAFKDAAAQVSISEEELEAEEGLSFADEDVDAED